MQRRLGQLAGDRAAAAERGFGGVWELRDTWVVLKVGSARAEEVWKGVPTAASSSSELRRRGRWCSGCLERETGGVRGGMEGQG